MHARSNLRVLRTASFRTFSPPAYCHTGKHEREGCGQCLGAALGAGDCLMMGCDTARERHRPAHMSSTWLTLRVRVFLAVRGCVCARGGVRVVYNVRVSGYGVSSAAFPI